MILKREDIHQKIQIKLIIIKKNLEKMKEIIKQII